MNTELTIRKTAFSENLVDCNGLRSFGFKEWIFHPGMLFNSGIKWWGGGGVRRSPHEGLDIAYFKGRDGHVRRLDINAKIPALYDGHIVKIGHDFLGKSLYVRHDIYSGDGSQLSTFYGHLNPEIGIGKGVALSEGDVFARISNPVLKKSVVPPHLHIAAAWIRPSLQDEMLSWEQIRNSPLVILLDPLGIIGCRYSVSRETLIS